MTLNQRCAKCGIELAKNALFCQQCGTRVPQQQDLPSGSDPYLGMTIDNTFVVESILGMGSMGVVYKARHRALDNYVAIKILKDDYLDNNVVLTRFQREAQAASGIQHPHIIRILHYGKTVHNAPYIAMECLEGDDLSDLIVRDFPFNQHRVANIILQVARALGAAHDARIIHRDLKPANIKVIPQPDGSELVKVLDFGIAKITDEAGDGLTREGAVCGTPAFMSPEQILGQQVTPATDIFSLGSILYFMLTNRLPFSGSTMVDIASSIMTEEPPLPSTVRIDAYVDPSLEAICLKAMQKDVANRYQSAHELEADLANIFPNITEADSPNARKRSVVLAAESGEIVTNGATQCALPVYSSSDSHQIPNLASKAPVAFSADEDMPRPAGDDSGECTRIDQRAYVDDEDEHGENETKISMEALDEDYESDLISVNSPVITAPVNSGYPQSQSPYSGPSGQFSVPSGQFRVPSGQFSSPSRQFSPALGQFVPPSPDGSMSKRVEAHYNQNPALETQHGDQAASKKKLLLIFIPVLILICALVIVIVILLSGDKSEDGKVADNTQTAVTDESGEDSEQEDKALDKDNSDDGALSPIELAKLTNAFADAGLDQLVWVTAYGLVYQPSDKEAAVAKADNANNAETDAEEPKVDEKAQPEAEAPKEEVAAAQEPTKQEAEPQPEKTAKAEEKPAETKPVAKAESKPAPAPAAKKPATPAKTGSSGGSGSSNAKKKIAEAEKAEKAGNTTKACTIYKNLLGTKDLSKEDRVKIQARIRKCGRALI